MNTKTRQKAFISVFPFPHNNITMSVSVVCGIFHSSMKMYMKKKVCWWKSKIGKHKIGLCLWTFHENMLWLNIVSMVSCCSEMSLQYQEQINIANIFLDISIFHFDLSKDLIIIFRCFWIYLSLCILCHWDVLCKIMNLCLRNTMHNKNMLRYNIL